MGGPLLKFQDSSRPAAGAALSAARLREEGSAISLNDSAVSASDALLIFDTDGVAVYVNRTAEVQFSVCVGDRLDARSPVLGGGRISCADGSVIAPGSGVAEKVMLRAQTVEMVEHQIRYPAGSVRQVLMSGAPIRDRTGQLRGSLFTLHDRQARIRRERDRMESLRGDLLRRMAGGIAHDYNNFLTVILGNLSLIREAAVDQRDVPDLLAAVEEASLAAKDLTRQLLAISRGDALAVGTADLATVASQARRHAISDVRIRCDISIPRELPLVAIGAEALRQVIEEILIAAAGSMPSGGTVRVRAELAEARGIVLEVRDEGQGFAESDLPHVFDPYFATWNRGHGLGLATSRAIVEQHGGAVAVTSVPGGGTTFRLRLPVRTGPDRPQVRRRAAVHRILLMDDEPGVLAVADRMLRRLGHEVLTAVDGEDAVRQFVLAEAEGTPVDLAILDLTVPGGTGGEVAAQRLHEIVPDLPLIVSSGYASGDVLVNYEKYGFLGVILKPYRLEELAEGLRQALPQGVPQSEAPTLWE